MDIGLFDVYIFLKIQPVWGTSSSKKNVKSKKTTFYSDSESESGSESGKV